MVQTTCSSQEEFKDSCVITTAAGRDNFSTSLRVYIRPT